MLSSALNVFTTVLLVIFLAQLLELGITFILSRYKENQEIQFQNKVDHKKQQIYQDINELNQEAFEAYKQMIKASMDSAKVEHYQQMKERKEAEKL